jgi:lipopolysaccharide export LptBFGC system permease protein LptF
MDLGKDGFVKTQLKFEKMIIPFSLSFDDVIKELRNPWEMSYKDLKRELDSLDRMGWKDNFLLTQLYLKISLPLSCVIVVFLSLPLAVMFSRKGRFAGLLVSVLLIFFYYGLFSFFVAMGKNNLINPFFAAFGANFIMLFMGLMLVYLVER